MISIYEGNTGQGKTYMTAFTMLKLLERNLRWLKQHKIDRPRLVATNMSVGREILEKYSQYIVYWQELEQLIELRQCDVIFDDMATYLDSQRWTDTPNSVKRWLRLHEHYGCDIYGNAQDFLTIDASVRRLTSLVTRITKIVGSRRPSATKPAVKHVWGVLMLREVNKENRDKDDVKREYEGWPRIEFLRRKYCELFDTAQEMKMSEYPPVHHIERACLTCGKGIVKHI